MLEASEDPPKEIWIVGGSGIYTEGMKYADVIDVTYVPDHVTNPSATKFPQIDETVFRAGPITRNWRGECGSLTTCFFT